MTDNKLNVIKRKGLSFTGERFVFDDELFPDIECEHVHRYIWASYFCNGKDVLDIACGSGYGSAILSQSAKRVFGIDINVQTINFAKKEYGEFGIEFKVGECESIPFKNEMFDVVISFETLEHISSQSQFIDEVHRVLRKGGLFICSTPDKIVYNAQISQPNPFHVRELTKEGFEKLLSNKFPNVSILGQQFLCGSHLAPIHSHEPIPILYSSENQTGEVSTSDFFFQPSFLLALASDSSLSQIRASFYEGAYGRNYLSALMGGIKERDAQIIQLNRSLEHKVEKNNLKIAAAKAAQSERNAALAKASQYRSDAETARQEVIELQNDIEKIKDERNAALAKASQYRSDAETARQEVKNTNREIVSLSEERARLKAYLDFIFSEYETFKKDVDNFEKFLKEISSNLEKNEDKIRDRDRAIDALVQWIEILEEDFNRLLASMRWRTGNVLINIVDVAFFRFRKQKANDHIKQIFTDYHKWKEQHKISTNIYHRTHSKASLGTLIVSALQNPRMAGKLLSWGRIVNFARTLTNSETNFRGKVYQHYVDTLKMERGKALQQKATFADEPGSNIIPRFHKIDVSIIIPAYNQWNYTKRCIQSIIRADETVAYEIILADDNSDDGTTQEPSFFDNLTVIRNEENLGFLRNCNNAAQHANGKYLLFLNNDTIIKENWLSSLYFLMEEDKDIAIAGSKLIFSDGTLQEAGGIVWEDGSAWNYGRGMNPAASEYNYVKEVDYVSGSSMMVRKSFWDEAGGFDERYIPAYCEDSDLAFEARKRGYKVVYQPASEIIHLEGISHGTDETSSLKSYQIKNSQKFYYKWSGVLKDQHFSNGQNVFLARDRSQNKKHILYIDHYVPHFDCDAGSQTALHYLKLLRDNNFSVVFLGDNFARMEPYTGVLQQLGIEVLYGHEWADNWKNWFKANADLIEYVFLNRPHISVKYIDFIRAKSHAKIIYYGHDLHYLREQRYLESKPELYKTKEIERWKKIEFSIISKADVIYFPSQVEVELLCNEFPGKTIRAIPAYILEKPERRKSSFENAKGILFVGGFGHPPNVQAVKYFLDKIFPYVIDKIPDIKFIVVGSKPPDWLTGYEHPNVDVRGFVSDDELNALYGKVRLTVVPLLHGSGVKGKVVESLHKGVPVITTPIGAEGLASNDALIVEKHPEAFAQKIVSLYRDPQYLAALSVSGQEFICKYFNVDCALEAISDDFDINFSRKNKGEA